MSTTSAVAVHVYGLDALRREGLRRELVDEVRFEKKELPRDKVGEPAMVVAVVTVSLVAIRALTAWLLKERRRRRVVHTIVVEHSDGRRVTSTLELDQSSSDAPAAEVIEQLAGLLELSPDVLAKALEK